MGKSDTWVELLDCNFIDPEPWLPCVHPGGGWSWYLIQYPWVDPGQKEGHSVLGLLNLVGKT